MITQTAPPATVDLEPPPADSERPNGTAAPQRDLLQESKRVQELIERAGDLRDPVARALLHECLHSLLAFYGEGLGRVLQVVRGCGDPGQQVLDRLLKDPVARALLLIHGLHPQGLESRLHQAIERIRPYMQSHGGNVELLSLENDFARLRLQGACQSCPSSSVTMELALRHALEELCPDLAGFEVEGAQTSPDSESATVPQSRPARWAVLEDLSGLPEGAAVSVEPEGVPLLVSRVNGSLYAYRNECPACTSPLDARSLREGRIYCAHGHGYEVQRAGQAVDDPKGHLDPFPLLVEEGAVKVALS